MLGIYGSGRSGSCKGFSGGNTLPAACVVLPPLVGFLIDSAPATSTTRTPPSRLLHLRRISLVRPSPFELPHTASTLLIFDPGVPNPLDFLCDDGDGDHTGDG